MVPARQVDGRLPPAAKARMSEINASGTWASALSTDEFAVIKSTGFEPVGQVLGIAVCDIGRSGGTSCPTYGVKATSAQAQDADDPGALPRRRSASCRTVGQQARAR